MACWIRALWRRNVISSLALALVCGIAAAAPLWIWAAAQRSADAVPHFVGRAGMPNLAVTVCPPDHDPARAFDECYAADQTEAFEAVRGLPSVLSASRGMWVYLRVATDRAPDAPVVLALFELRDDATFPTIYGTPVVVSGRLADPRAPDELVISEIAAEVLGAGPGSTLVLNGVGEADAPDDPATRFTSRVTGVVRTVADLMPTDAKFVRGLGIPQLWVGPGWTAAHQRQVRSSGGAITVALRNGDADAFRAELTAALPGRVVDVGPVFSAGELLTLQQATRYEARVGSVVATFAAIAAALFVIQAIARQARKEGADGSVLNALGATGSQLQRAAIVRWGPVAVGAGLVAVVASTAASAAGPVGLARRGPWSHGIHVDVIVVVAGLLLTPLAVLAGAAVGSQRRGRGRALATVPRLAGPAAAATGVSLLLRSARRGGAASVATAIVGTAAAVALLVASTGLVLTIRRVTSEPERFGAQWDALVGEPNTEPATVEQSLRSAPGVDAAAWLLGTTVTTPSGGQLWVQTLEPMSGLVAIAPVITSGTAPAADDEIALGRVALDREDRRLGDHIDLVPAGESSPRQFTIVGTTLVTDGVEPNVGLGGLVTPAGLDRLAPGVTGSAAVRVVRGPTHDDALEALHARFPDTYVPTSVPSTIQNLDRVSPLPVLLAGVAAGLAAVTMAHALLTGVRRQRRDLAICKAIGFTRRQLSVCVATEANAVAAGALVLGLPIGVLAARRVWQVLADGLGLATTAVVPAAVLLVTTAGALLVANAAAALPGWRARRIRPAEALRTE